MKSIKNRKLLSLVLAVAVLFTSLVFSTNTIAEKISEEINIKGGMVLSKAVEKTEDPNVFKITLGAYSTGEAYTITEDVSHPVDIVLIVDASRSMEYDFVSGTSRWKATQKAVNKFIDDIEADAKKYNVNHRIAITTFANNSYVYVGSNRWNSTQVATATSYDYSKYVKVSGKDNSTYYSLANSNALFEYTGSGYKAVTVSRKWSGGQRTGHYEYTYKFNDKSTVSSSNDNTKPNLGSKVLYSYDTKNVLSSAFQDVTVESQISNIRKTIGNPDKGISSPISLEIGTYPSGAASLANDIFTAYKDDYGKEDGRAKLVVYFTDGVPGSDGSTFNDSEATKTLPYFKQLKASGVDVYSIGVFPDSNCSNPQTLPSNSGNSNKANRFMFIASSFYPKANSMTDTGSVITAYDEKSYYMSPQDIDSLADTFAVISNSIHKEYTEVVMTEKSMIKDVITPYFAGPNSIKDIKYYYQKCTGIDPKDNRLRTFAPDEIEATDLEVRIERHGEDSGEDSAIVGNMPNDTVIATNFNYKENWCGMDDKTPRGKKVVLEFYVTVRDGFIGGNGVPTNQAISGLYDDDGNLLPGFEFPMPKPQDVEIKDYSIKAKAETKHVYLYGDLSKDDMIVDATIQVYDSEGQEDCLLKLDTPNYGLSQWRVDFIDVTTEIPKAPMSDITEDTTYNIAATVAPKITEGACISKNDTSEDMDILCYVPRITFKDTSILSGKSPNYADNLVKIEWVHKDESGEWKTSDKMIGTAPKLDFEYSPVEGAIYDDTNVKVTKVYIDSDDDGNCDTDITDYCLFEHETCDVEKCSFDSAKGHFMVHVSDRAANIVIKNTGDTVDENDTFVYTITSEDYNSYKQTVVIKGKGSVVITGLPVGNFTVTQDEKWSYNYACTTNPQEKLLIGEPADGRNNVFVFENDKSECKNIREAWDYIKNLFKPSGIVAGH